MSDTVYDILLLAALNEQKSWSEERGTEFTPFKPSLRKINEWLDGAEDVPANVYLVDFVEEYGGEGQGDELWFIYKITNTKSLEVRYAKIEAAWVSWDGVYWDEAEVYEVWPKEVMKTIWSAKKP